MRVSDRSSPEPRSMSSRQALLGRAAEAWRTVIPASGEDGQCRATGGPEDGNRVGAHQDQGELRAEARLLFCQNDLPFCSEVMKGALS